ncbi:unnamed protein product [Mortierella alpina]
MSSFVNFLAPSRTRLSTVSPGSTRLHRKRVLILDQHSSMEDRFVRNNSRPDPNVDPNTSPKTSPNTDPIFFPEHAQKVAQFFSETSPKVDPKLSNESAQYFS